MTQSDTAFQTELFSKIRRFKGFVIVQIYDIISDVLTNSEHKRVNILAN
nr:MAG TPA: hypothetical protein [Caudoviricetes sp.]